MKTKFAVILIATMLAIVSVTNAQTNLSQVPNLESNGVPTVIAGQLPPGAAAFNANGLDFTNVNYKAATGTELLSGGGGGTLAYVQGDADLFHNVFSSLDIGIGLEAALSASGSGFHSLGTKIELIKNLSNFQLVGKVGGSRNFDTNPGWFVNFGFDVNYNLANGTGLTFLGSGQQWFTYVGAGTDFNTKDFSLGTGAPANLEKDFRLYVGVAF
jgi:hypothetical protein